MEFNEKVLLPILTKNIRENQKALLDLLKAYDLAELGRDIEREQIRAIDNKILAENEFYASIECGETKVGDRITNESNDFLLSGADFKRCQDLELPLLVEAGICDEDGCFKTQWYKIVVKSRNELYDFIVEKIVPATLAPIFRENRHSVVVQEKLIGIARKFFVAA